VTRPTLEEQAILAAEDSVHGDIGENLDFLRCTRHGCRSTASAIREAIRSAVEEAEARVQQEEVGPLLVALQDAVAFLMSKARRDPEERRIVGGMRAALTTYYEREEPKP